MARLNEFGHILLKGNLVGDIKTTTYNDKDGNARTAAFFSVVHNESKFNDNTKAWENGPSVYTKLNLFGNVADDFLASASNLPKGTTLSISGTIRVTTDKAYIGSDGVQHPERHYDGINVDDIAVVLSKNIQVSVAKKNQNGQNTQPNNTGQTQPQNNAAQNNTPAGQQPQNTQQNLDNFVNIPDGVDNSLPFGNETTSSNPFDGDNNGPFGDDNDFLNSLG